MLPDVPRAASGFSKRESPASGTPSPFLLVGRAPSWPSPREAGGGSAPGLTFWAPSTAGPCFCPRAESWPPAAGLQAHLTWKGKRSHAGLLSAASSAPRAGLASSISSSSARERPGQHTRQETNGPRHVPQVPGRICSRIYFNLCSEKRACRLAGAVLAEAGRWSG